MASTVRQTTNPALDLYKYWLNIIRYTSPETLNPTECSSHQYGLFTFQDGQALKVVRGVDDENKKPILTLNNWFTIWPNGHFWLGTSVYAPRWDNHYRRLLESHTFLYWSYAIGSEKILLVQDTPRRHNHAQTWGEGYSPEVRDWKRARPYLTYGEDRAILDTDYIYKLVKVNDDWVIRAAKPERPGWQTAPQAKNLIMLENEYLAANYARSARRYDRYRKREENRVLREQGYFRSGSRRAQRTDILRSFVDRMIVFEPKNPPPGQILLPFTREEAMSNGR